MSKGRWLPERRNLEAFGHTPTYTTALLPSATPEPAVYNGIDHGNSTFTPKPGMLLIAWIENQICRNGMLEKINGQTVYTVRVKSETLETGSESGSIGETIVFTISGQVMAPFPKWDNSQLWEPNL